MNPFRIRNLAGLGIALCLVACGSSPPNQYYRLTPQASPGSTAEKPALGVGPVSIPDYLKRSGMVYSGGANQLLITEQQRWAEPLDEGIERVVAINLARLLNTDNLRLFPWQLDDIPDYAVQLVVLELDTEGPEALLVADWVIKRPAENASVTRRISRLRHPLPPGPVRPADLAPAYSALFYQLSEEIGAAISAAESAAPGASTP
jgi:hypothetical protein